MKQYVDVIVLMQGTGKVMPQTLICPDGRKFAIDKIKDVRRAVSLKGGGVGIRYTCIIAGQKRYLFLDDYKWFVEVE